VPGLPELPGLDGLGGLGDVLGGLFGGSSAKALPRPAPGGGSDARSGPTVGQLTELYDADLVGLMVPGMVVGK
jgi:hypothetical protein